MDRKEFIRYSCILCGGALLGSAFLESCKKNNSAPVNVNFTLNLADQANSALNNVGGFLVHDSVVIIRMSLTSYAALSNICTHNGCTVSYDNSSKILICPCHGGTFDTNGNVTSGPPPSSLTKYKTSLSGNILSVTS